MKRPLILSTLFLGFVLSLLCLWLTLAYTPEPDPAPDIGSPTPSVTHTPTSPPVPSATPTAVVPSVTPSATPQPTTAVPTATPSQTPPATQIPTATSWPEVYVVQRGDYLILIAGKVYGREGCWYTLYRWNRDVVEDANLIFAGERLRIRHCD